MKSELARHLRAYADAAIDVAPTLLVMLRPELAPAAVAIQASTSYVKSSLAQLREAWLIGVAETVQETERRVGQLAPQGEIDLRARLMEPDMVFLLGVAKDQYAVDQFRSRLHRFARVLAGRVIDDPTSDIGADHRAAIAATALPDIAILILQVLHDWRRIGEEERRAAPPEIPPALRFHVKTTQFFRTPCPPPSSAADVDAVEAALVALKQHALVLEGRSPKSLIQSIECADGSHGWVRECDWHLTASGEAFLLRVQEIEGT